jgi:hypothetical protein
VTVSREELKKALWRGSCYCEVAIGNPMMRDHSDLCKRLIGEEVDKDLACSVCGKDHSKLEYEE